MSQPPESPQRTARPSEAVATGSAPSPGPRLAGRVVGSLKGSVAGAASYVVVRDRESGAALGQATFLPDGRFELPELPREARGRSVDVEVVVAEPGGQTAAVTTAVDIPRAGDAAVQLHLGQYGASVGSLTPAPTQLDPSRLDELLKGQEASAAGFAQTRAAARRRQPATEVDWTGAVDYLETLRRPDHPRGLLVPAKDLATFDKETVFRRPSPGLRGTLAPRTARLRLTQGERATLQSVVPTICEAVEARGDQRALVRRPRLRERLAEAMRIEGLTIPPVPPTPSDSPPDAPPDEGTLEDLEKKAERAALRGAAAVVSDLGRTLDEPSTATDLKRLHNLAQELELSGGPANVAAAREVHTLQVAFEQPVTKTFDKDLIRLWGRLENLRAQLKAQREIDLQGPPAKPSHDALISYLDHGRQTIAANATEAPPQLVRDRFPQVGARTWARLSDEARDIVLQRAAAPSSTRPDGRARLTTTRSAGQPAATARSFLGNVLDAVKNAVADAMDVVDEPTSEIDELLDSSPSVIAEADRTLGELRERLRGPYEFTVSVPGSVNYGLMLTYRQEWSPVRYQVGRLVDTIPLTPGERRELKVVTTRKLRENRKTVTTQSRESQRELSSTRRLESEAIEAATMAINNQVSANSSFTIGAASVGGSAQFSANQTSESRRTLKNFSEMAQKAVDSLKEQVEVTVESTSELTTEETESRTLTNPNNEITITYLLYELERRYRVETQLHRVRPVILVAMPMPSPDEITPAWILEQSWPIREALLDDTLLEVLDGLEESQSGAAVEYEVRRAALIEQRRVANQLVTEYEALEALARKRRETVVGLVQEEGEAASEEWGTGQRIAAAVVTGGISEVFGWGSGGEDERAAAQREAAQQALEYLEKQIAAKGAAMTSAAEALRRAVDKFTEAAVERRRTTLSTSRLQVHIRDHIFHYMHAIWAATHPDHRYFELYDDLVPFHVPDPNAYTLQPAGAGGLVRDLPGIPDSGSDLELTVAAPDVTQVPPRRRLADIADLDRPLGYRGNMVIFELRQCSQLTDHMAAEYLDPLSGVADPGTLSGISSGELVDYIEAAIEHGILDDNELTRLKDMARRLQRDQREWADELVLPTGQIFLEALKGQTTLLEPFKLVHRGLDVLAVEEDVRNRRIDALRRVRKLAQSDLERDPTSVEHFYLGETPDVVAVEDGGPGGPAGDG